MKRIVFGFALAAMVFFSGVTTLSAQAANRAYYVNSEDGNDDNNGRSAEQAFSSLQKAFDLAKTTAIKKIIILKYDEANSASYTFWAVNGGNIENGGDAEILLTTLDNSVPFYLRTGLRVSGKSKVRIENIRLVRTSVEVQGDAQLIIGTGAELSKIRVSSGTLILEGNAKLKPSGDSRYDEIGIELVGAKVTLKDDVEISGFLENGIKGSGGRDGELIMQDNAKITGCARSGMEIHGESITLKGNASISGNKGSGIYMEGGTLLMQDDASITGNTGSNGGGIYLGLLTNDNIRVTLTGKAVISGNKARKGGGIYVTGTEKEFNGKSNERYGTISSSTGRSVSVSLIVEGTAAIKDNTAGEGGGIYLTNGSIEYNFVGGRERTKPATLTQTLYGFTMKGGTISGNKADYGAGVYIAAEEVSVPAQRPFWDGYPSAPNLGEWKIQDTGNQFPKPAFTFTAGSITGNEAAIEGGGIFVRTKGSYAPGRGTVTGNTSGDGDGPDVYTLP